MISAPLKTPEVPVPPVPPVNYVLRLSVPEENWPAFEYLLARRHTGKVLILTATVELTARSAVLQVASRGYRPNGLPNQRRSHDLFDLGTDFESAQNWITMLFAGHPADAAATVPFWPEIMADERTQAAQRMLIDS
jgi:hypothetical protein